MTKMLLLLTIALSDVNCQFQNNFGYPAFPNFQQTFGNQLFGSSPYANQPSHVDNNYSPITNRQNPTSENFYFPNAYQPLSSGPVWDGSYQQNPYQSMQQQSNPTINYATTSKPTTTHQVIQQKNPFQQQRIRGISKIMCEEYKKPTVQITQSSSLSFGATNAITKTLKCDKSTGLIVGGETAKKGEFPSMALIGYPNIENDVEFKCGGTIISERFILTAAHCESDRTIKPNVVRVGEHSLVTKQDGEMDYNIKRFIRHENYNRITFANDIALVEVNQNIAFSDLVRPACLSGDNALGVDKFIATGWGNTEYAGKTSDVLMKVSLKIIDNKSCQEKSDNTIFESQICAQGLTNNGVTGDSCQGDSGGPLLYRQEDECLFRIVGITSYGIACGFPVPSVYTRVSFYIKWIEDRVWP